MTQHSTTPSVAIGPERLIRVAFRTAGALMLASAPVLAGWLLAKRGLTDWLLDVGGLSALLFSWLAFVAAVVGLLGVVGMLGNRVRRVAQVDSAVFMIGAVALPLLMTIGLVQLFIAIVEVRDDLASTVYNDVQDEGVCSRHVAVAIQGL